MRCCVSFCRNTSYNVSTSEGQGKDISFHDFPSEEHLRAAWLRALSKEDIHVPDSAVVCSQHFLYDDIYETQSGLRQIVTGAIPSTVQICMICLDTDSKLILMSKHKLEKAYEKLTEHSWCDLGNLKQTLCVQCAQRLINFSRFRDNSLRARALMMDLVEKHELIKRGKKQIINCAKHQTKNNMVLTMEGLNNSELSILEHHREDSQIQISRKEEENRQTELEETGQRVVVKTEESDVSMLVDGDTEVLHEHNNDKDSVWDPLKYESITFQCTLCMEEFVHEHAYIQHVCVHLQNGEGDVKCDSSQVCKPHTTVSSISSHSSLVTENKSVYLPVPITFSSINVSTSEGQGKGIGFHGALGKQDSHPPDSAVVYSEHFLTDDIQEKECRLRQIITGAIRSKVQVCMTCLDTDSKLILMSKHQLEKAYEKLTGHPSCYLEKRNQTLCLQCAQTLINFSLFRFNSLRARAQLMVLVEKHELITRRHIKMIKHTKYQRKRTMVLKMEGLNNSDLPILEHPSEDRQLQNPRNEEEENRQKELEETGQRVVVKTEESEVSMLVDEDTEVLQEHNNDKDSVWDPLKYESITFQCTLCMEEFVHEHAYIQHVCVHLQNGEGDDVCDSSQVCKPHTAVSSSSSHSSLITENKQADPGPCAQAAHTTVYATRVASHDNHKTHATEEAETTQKTEPALEVGNGRRIDSNCKTNFNVNSNTNCVVTLHEFLTKTRKALRSIATKDFSCQTDFPTTEYIEPVTNISGVNTNVVNIQCNNSSQTRQSSFPCEICGENYKRKSLLFKHIRKAHPEVKPFTCNICQHKYKIKKCLTKHMVNHTSEKPYRHCKFCNYKTVRKWGLIAHVRTHTGEKPFSCELCEYKFVAKGELVRHMRTHTGERPHSCALCKYRCALKSNLKIHMRTHTGEKP